MELSDSYDLWADSHVFYDGFTNKTRGAGAVDARLLTGVNNYSCKSEYDDPTRCDVLRNEHLERNLAVVGELHVPIQQLRENINEKRDSLLGNARRDHRRGNHPGGGSDNDGILRRPGR